MPLGFHLVVRSRSGAQLAATATKRRQLARIVLTVSKDFALLAFGLADNHLHLYPVEERGRTHELGRRLCIALSRGLAVAGGLFTSLIKPVADSSHAYKLFDYVLRQGMRHQLDSDPLLEATNVPDLLGLRPLGVRTALLVRRHLPRVARKQLLGLLGVESLEPADEPLDAVVEAGLAAAALTTLDGGQASRQLRRAVAEVVGKRLPRPRLARLLALQPRSLRRILSEAAPRELVQAIRLQLDLRRQKACDLARIAGAFVETFVGTGSQEETTSRASR